MGRLVVFAAWEQSRPCSTPAPAQTAPAGTSPTPLPPAGLPSCSQSQGARTHLSFLSDIGMPGCSLRRGAPKTIPVLPDGFHFRRLLHSALCCKSCCQTSRYASGYQQQENLQSWLLWLTFSIFVSEQLILQPTAGWAGSLWLYFFWGNLMAMQRPQRPGCKLRLFSNLTCQEPANKLVKTQVMPLQVTALVTCHAISQHFLHIHTQTYLNQINRKYGDMSGYKQIGNSYLHLVKRKWGKSRQRIRGYFSVHEAIRIAFPLPTNSWEEAFESSKAKVKSSTRKVGLYKQRGSGCTALSCWNCPFLYQTGINISTAWEQYHSAANPLGNKAHGQSPASHWFLSCSVVLKASTLFSALFSPTKAELRALQSTSVMTCSECPCHNYCLTG